MGHTEGHTGAHQSRPGKTSGHTGGTLEGHTGGAHRGTLEGGGGSSRTATGGVLGVVGGGVALGEVVDSLTVRPLLHLDVALLDEHH